MNQSDHSVPRRAKERFAASISLTYAAFGTIWILASDRVLGLLIRDPTVLTRFQTYKGGVFVALTAFFCTS